jgi:hypothetical protein
MNKTRGWTLLLVAGMVALLVIRAEAQQGLRAEGSHFVKVGRHHINVDRIIYTREEGDSLEVVFGSGGSGDRLRLAGDEAKAMRQWLDERSPVLKASRFGNVLMEGVDLNFPKLR